MTKSIHQLLFEGMTIEEIVAYQRDSVMEAWARAHWGDQWEVHLGGDEASLLFDHWLDMGRIHVQEGGVVTFTSVVHELGCSEPCTCGAWDRAERTR